MELKEFVLDEAPIVKLFPDVARAPPRKQFERYVVPEGEFAYGPAVDEEGDGAHFGQLPADDDAFFNGVLSLSKD
ncbi:MAG: hypothetical protein WC956_03090 [bacterium]